MSTYKYEQKDIQRRTSGTFSNQFFKDVKGGLYKIPALKIKNRCNYDKLKHFLKLSSKRLKTEIRSKDELILKHRNRVAMHMKLEYVGLAIPLVVQIEKQGQLRKTMVTVGTFCDILLERFSILQTMKSLDDINEEAVSSIIWAAQHLAFDELRQVAEQLTNKYGKCYAEACKKMQVATINSQLVSQISFSKTSKDVIENIFLDIAEEYKIEYLPGKEDVSSMDDPLDVELDKEVGLIVDAPLVIESCSPTPSSVSQLDIPNARCQAPSPGGSCLATSPGGTKVWCNFDISPAKSQILNKLCPHNITDLASSPFLISGNLSRSNPFMDDNNYLLDMDRSKRELEELDYIDIKVANPFKEVSYQYDAKAASIYQHDLLQVAVPDNLSSSWKSKHLNSPFKRPKSTHPAKNHGVDVPDNESSWKSKHVDPELLFQLDFEDM